MRKRIYLSVIAAMIFHAKLDAQGWIELGGPGGFKANGPISSICSDPTGNVYAGGSFTDFNYNEYVAKWNGSSWSELEGLAAPNDPGEGNNINAVCSDNSGNIYAAGQIRYISDICEVAICKGDSCYQLGNFPVIVDDEEIYSLCSDQSGNIYAGGEFSDGTSVNSGSYYVAQYNDTGWTPLGGANILLANGAINSVCSDPSGNIYAAGFFTNGSGTYYVGQYNETAWNELGGPNSLAANGVINSICSDAAGNIYAAGSFTNSQGMYYVAKYNGTTWSELGGPNSLAANGSINTIAIDPSGNVYAAGSFMNVYGSYYVAKYNGKIWSEVGGIGALSANYPIYSVCSDTSGNIYAAGEFLDSASYAYVAMYKAGQIESTTVPVDFIKILPNPTNDICLISSKERLSDVTFRLLDLSGQVVYEQSNETGFDFFLNLSAQPQGMYFLQMIRPGSVWTAKVVKE